LCQHEDVYYPVIYGDGSICLRGHDLAFVQWLFRKDGYLEILKAVDDGIWVQIDEEALKEIGARVVGVNRKRQCAEVEIEALGKLHRMWLSYELRE
jgi:hypothetical protein